MKTHRYLISIASFIAITTLFLGNPSDIEANIQKMIRINLTTQTLTATENGQTIYHFPVSTGRQVTPTPTGGFWPWIKLRYDRMTGGTPGTSDYYDLLNVPHVIYFYNENYPTYLGYGIHGTYWHNNFGHPMSHGCINLSQEHAAQLFPWIDLPQSGQPGSGTIIIITGQTPTT